MNKKPLFPRFPHMLHGGDYNPDQWLHMPEILKEDIRLMKLAKCNAMSIGIFAWTALEPEEGRFTFEWLDERMDTFAKNGIYAVLATPSGAKPAWMSRKYPEILRVNQNGIRNLHGQRHNHCFTSPVYREKVRIINTELAKRYGKHPALLIWHISNEYSGECHCDLCREAFRTWLKRKYHDDLDTLNKAWYAAFWSHTFTDWNQIDTETGRGECLIHGMNLDWKRFVTDQTLDFMKAEIRPLNKFAPDIPVTTNFMGTYEGLDYWKLRDAVDIVSWDCYPQWHRPDGAIEEPSFQAFVHTMNRCMKNGRPFMLMESTPSMTNWQPVSKLKRPGMHLLASLQAVAHGSDTVQYFQWRKSRGSCEKFHGAVVDHSGRDDTRVFRDVAGVGDALTRLDSVIGTTVHAPAAIIYDWENRWAIDDTKGLRTGDKGYVTDCHRHFTALWKLSVNMDVINMDQDFSPYRLLIAPMLYMIKPGVAERIGKFVKKGGILVTTYFSGIADENDLCFPGGFPGPLRNVLGIWDEEIDSIFPQDRNSMRVKASNELGLKGMYAVKELCSLIHAETADVLAVYTRDFYAGRPALTSNSFGKGRAYYLAARADESFLDDFYGALVRKQKITRAIDIKLPSGVIAASRTDGKNEYVFLMNFTQKAKKLSLGNGKYHDLLAGNKISGECRIQGYGVKVLSRE